ncbi:MAG: globin domain-containing protein [Wenzhouxiangellaceae bacterium]|nr:globin domain-containing protein [Wenzhouxiangellaceae bacterium]
MNAANKIENIERFHHSLDRAGADPEFLDRFYRSLMARSRRIQKIFEGIDMARLKRALRSSLRAMVLAADDVPGAEDELRALGRRHRKFALQPEHFDLWKGSLLKTVAECDPKFDDELQQIWADVIGAGIEIIRDGMQPRPGQDRLNASAAGR